eukprot:4157765-Amphidinium_carterae.1
MDGIAVSHFALLDNTRINAGVAKASKNKSSMQPHTPSRPAKQHMSLTAEGDFGWKAETLQSTRGANPQPLLLKLMLQQAPAGH